MIGCGLGGEEAAAAAAAAAKRSCVNIQSAALLKGRRKMEGCVGELGEVCARFGCERLRMGVDVVLVKSVDAVGGVELSSRVLVMWK